jgi:iron complex outermembrane receptor protein
VALANALGTGIINPFLLPGEKQSQAAIDLINSTSAKGVVLYGGKTTLTQADAALSGEIFKLPAGAGHGRRRHRPAPRRVQVQRRPARRGARPVILNAPFDDQNALDKVSRDIKAVYAELIVPVTKELEVNLAGRQDHYSGFGNTFNPKISFRYQPMESLLFRGSYNKASAHRRSTSCSTA